MLEAMRQHSRSMIIYVLFGIIIAVFILTFGPQSGGCVVSVQQAGKVDGRPISEADFRFGYAAATFGRDVPEEEARALGLKERVMDSLIEREIYAQAAERLGFQVGEDEVNRDIEKGDIVILGEQMPKYLTGLAFKDGVLDYDLFKRRFVANLGVSVRQFVNQEKRELLAQKMRDLLRGSVVASPAEVERSYIASHATVTVDYAQFAARSYEDRVVLTPAEVNAYAASHAADLQKEYQAKKATAYTGLPQQVHVQQIFFAAPKGDAAKVAAAKAKATAALARIAKGEDFGAVARAVSEDAPTRDRGEGGDAGWRRVKNSGADPAIETALSKLKAGEVSSVVTTDAGVYVLKAAGFRQGDLTFDQVKRDLAEEALRSERGEAMAQAAAKAALARIEPGMAMAQLFPKSQGGDAAPASQASSAPAGIDPSLPPLVEGTPTIRGSIPGLGDDPHLIHQIFDEMKAGEVARAVYEKDDPLGGKSWFVYQLRARKDADLTDFAKHEATYVAAYEDNEFNNVNEAWIDHACVSLRDGGKISVDQSFVTYEGTSAPQQPYVPCRGAEMLGMR